MVNKSDKLPLVVDVKRNSLEDGPGIRSVVFFKGCPLRCVFCHNPEAQSAGVEIAFTARNCIKCGDCKKICPTGAIDLELPGRIHREKCVRCGECARVCPGNGLRRIGLYYTVEDLTKLLLRDYNFYRHSGGGVTLSGGECTIYPDYLEALLKSLKSKGVHVVLETAGYFDYDTFRQKILPYLDLVYYDIKIADAAVHTKYTGQPNQLILENFRRLLTEEGVEVHPRIPLVPGITSTEENLSAIVDFLCDAGADSASLLSYNPMWIGMAVSLGRRKPSLPESFMKPEEEEIRTMFAAIIEEKKIHVKTLMPAGT